MSISITSANQLLDLMLGTGHDASYPATVYVALFVGATECAGNAYARVAVTNDDTNWPAASSGSKANGTDITFPEATGDWGGTVTAFKVMSASTGGYSLCGGDLDAGQTPANGNTPFFLTGDLVVNFPDAA